MANTRDRGWVRAAQANAADITREKDGFYWVHYREYSQTIQSVEYSLTTINKLIEEYL